MFVKTTVGRGFYGIYSYVLDEDSPSKGAEVIGGNMGGLTARELSSEVRPFRQQRSDIEKPVWHLAVAFHPDEHLSNQRMLDACEKTLDQFGVDREAHQYIVVRHYDTLHAHAHIVLNRISTAGKLLDLNNEHRRLKPIARQVEVELGLRQTHEKTTAFQDYLRTRIEQTAATHPAIVEFCQALQAAEITPRFVIRNHAISGVTYTHQGIEMAGSKLGREFTFPGLQKYHDVVYQPERDDLTLQLSYVARTGVPAEELTRDYMRQQIRATATPGMSLADFCMQLREHQLYADFRYRGKRLSKLDFYHDGERCSGKQLGEEFTVQGLQERLGLTYVPERDDATVLAYHPKSAVQQLEVLPVVTPAPPLDPYQRNSERERQEQPQRQLGRSQMEL